MAKFFFTTHSTSLIAKRSSENRTYTHAVWIQMAHSTYISKLKRAIKSYEELNVSYRQKAEQGGTTTKWGHHTTPEQYLGYIFSNEEAIREIQAKLDADTGVTPDPWVCAHWCGREDLAQKQASSWFNKGYHVEVTVAKERDKKFFSKVGK